MPIAVYVLALSIFALGTSEFMLSGLLPPIAADLGVSIPDAGLLISAFAVGMLVAAPLLAAATLRLPHKLTLLGMLAVFLLGNLAGAVSPGYGLLFASRVVSAAAAAGFWAVAAVTTVAMVPERRRGRALAVMAGGLTVANVLGVPAGTWLGQLAGWRSAFWAVAALTAVAMIGVLLLVPAVRPSAERPSLRGELRSYRDPELWLAFGITSASTAMAMATFSYLAPLLTEVSGLPVDWLPAVLGLYGVGAVIGITLGGRFADVHPLRTLAGGFGAAVVVFAALAVAGTSVPVAVAAAFLLGLTSFVTNPALNVRVFALASSAPTLAGASNVSAFNVGIVLAPWLGGLIIDAGLGYLSVTWVSIALGVLALGGVALASRMRQRVLVSIG
ncbi:Cmx/CmrA family chloramphenicol efflux MFS transporter [Amycolatopsis sp. 195334CR]|uniref:Cmx/CmrA family chloramphenicol efflux MFS transporter n=1 Tax=Amycolatopsis sp. 195334CR TaxID=2814588 RepID=UPI001A8F7262|nr:Cmx/CmrA family chloramphenicol efflux MFS transporter [Amycolatopsis sp. 195334CR]MBN6039375.1 MFS transporter [Amycolatopsis sp. 195334CR]